MERVEEEREKRELRMKEERSEVNMRPGEERRWRGQSRGAVGKKKKRKDGRGNEGELWGETRRNRK